MTLTGYESRAVLNRLELHDLETELAEAAPMGVMAIADDDPRRCPCAGLGKLHDVRRDPDGVRRCFNCRRPEAVL